MNLVNICNEKKKKDNVKLKKNNDNKFLTYFRNLHIFNLTFITTVKIIKFLSVDHVFVNVQLQRTFFRVALVERPTRKMRTHMIIKIEFFGRRRCGAHDRL